MKHVLLLFLFVWMCCGQSLLAQIDPIPTPPYVDATDLRKVMRKKSSTKEEESGTPQKGKLMKFIVPIFGANPTLGAFYGVGGTGAIFLGNPETTSISSLNASLQITTKNQFVAGIKGTIMTPDNGWEMLVDLKYSFFSENTYGLGSDNSQPINESWNWGGISTGDGGAQPLTFNQTKIYYTALKEVTDNFYIGIGYHLDYHYKIEDINLDLEAPDTVITSHYAYNTINEISTTEYSTSGISFNLVYDSRDHTVNPYKGAFIQIMNRNNPDKLGSCTGNGIGNYSTIQDKVFITKKAFVVSKFIGIEWFIFLDKKMLLNSFYPCVNV